MGQSTMGPWTWLFSALLLANFSSSGWCTSSDDPQRLQRLEDLVSTLMKEREQDRALLQLLQDKASNDGSDTLRSVESQLSALRNDLQALVGCKETEESFKTELLAFRSELDDVHREASSKSKTVGDSDHASSETPREKETLRWVRASLEEVRAQIAALANVSATTAQLATSHKVDNELKLLESDLAESRRQFEEEMVARKRLQAQLAQITIDVEDLRMRDSKTETNVAFLKQQISQLREDLHSAQSSTSHSKHLKHHKSMKAHHTKFKKDSTGQIEENETTLEDGDDDGMTDDLLKFFSARNEHHLRHAGGGDGRVKAALQEVHIALRHLYSEQEKLKRQVLHVQHNHSALAGDVRHLWGRVGDLLNVSHTWTSRHTNTDRSMADLLSRVVFMEEQAELANRSLDNLSNMATGIDKLHTSTVQLFESMEKLEEEYDNSLQEIRREVSKLEYNTGQVSSMVSVLKEDESSHFESVKRAQSDVTLVRQRLDTHDARLAVLQSEIAAVGTSKGTEDVRESLRDYKISNLETRVSMLAQSALVQEGVVNDTFKQLDGKVGLEHVTKWAQSADGLDEDLRNVSQRVQHVEDIMKLMASHLPNDCSEVDRSSSGVSAIYPKGSDGPLRVYCDMDSSGGGWTVIQRRLDTTEDYNRDWASYKHGFGDMDTNFWIGNEALTSLTSSTGRRPWSARFEMTDNNGRHFVADYSQFSVGDERSGYKLHVGGYSGNASDALKYHDGMRFSTRDADNDDSAGVHCASQYEGGWWYSHCQHVNINGKYNIGLTWFDVANNEWLQLSRVQVKIRPGDVTQLSSRSEQPESTL